MSAPFFYEQIVNTLQIINSPVYSGMFKLQVTALVVSAIGFILFCFIFDDEIVKFKSDWGKKLEGYENFWLRKHKYSLR